MNLPHNEFTTWWYYHMVNLPHYQFTTQWTYQTMNLPCDDFTTQWIYHAMNLSPLIYQTLLKCGSISQYSSQMTSSIPSGFERCL